MLTITDKQIRTLNKARTILQQIGDDSTAAYLELWSSREREDERGADAHDLGRLTEAATQAADSIFNVLTNARCYCRIPLSDDQIYDRPKERT